MRDDALVEPAVQQHVANGGAHGGQVEAEEGEVVEPPGLEGKVEVLPQVENVERKPADDEEDDGGNQEVRSPHVPPLFLGHQTGPSGGTFKKSD